MAENDAALDRAREIISKATQIMPWGPQTDSRLIAQGFADAIREERQKRLDEEDRANLMCAEVEAVEKRAAALELALKRIASLRDKYGHFEGHLAASDAQQIANAALSGDTSALTAHDAATRKATLLEAADIAEQRVHFGVPIPKWLRELAEKEG